MDMDEQGVDVQIVYPTAAGQMLGREFRDPQLLAACCRAYNDWSADYCSKTSNRVKWGRHFTHAGRGRIDQGSESCREKRRYQFLCAPQPGPVAGLFFTDDYMPLWAEVEKTRTPDFYSRFRLGVGRVFRRSDGHPRHRPHPVASVRGDGCDGGSHLVRRHRKIPQAGASSRSRPTADGFPTGYSGWNSIGISAATRNTSI